MKLKAIVCAVIMALAVNPIVADCVWVTYYTEEGIPYYVRECTPPIYYNVLTSEPNWCDYYGGDGVFLRFDPTVPYAPVTGYFVVQFGDYTTTPPPGFYNYHFYVFHNSNGGCGYSVF